MTDESMDFIYDTIEALAIQRNYKAIDTILWVTNIHRSSRDLILTLLTTTLACKNQLKIRVSFFEEAKRELGIELVKGLE